VGGIWLEVILGSPFESSGVLDGLSDRIERQDIGSRSAEEDEGNGSCGVGFPGDIEGLADGEDCA